MFNENINLSKSEDDRPKYLMQELYKEEFK